MSPIKTPLFQATAWLAVLSLALPASAQLLPLGRRNDSVLLHIPAKDAAAFKAFIAQTLNTGQPDVAHEWTSSAGSGGQPVKVLLTPGPATETRSAGRCRLLSSQVQQRAAHESWKIWFCQQANGAWKISGLD